MTTDTDDRYISPVQKVLELQAELERVKAERDGFERECEALENENARLLDRLDKALSALREIERAGYVGPEALSREGLMARAAIAEIEGEAT